MSDWFTEPSYCYCKNNPVREIGLRVMGLKSPFSFHANFDGSLNLSGTPILNHYTLLPWLLVPKWHPPPGHRGSLEIWRIQSALSRLLPACNLDMVSYKQNKILVALQQPQTSCCPLMHLCNGRSMLRVGDLLVFSAMLQRLAPTHPLCLTSELLKVSESALRTTLDETGIEDVAGNS